MTWDMDTIDGRRLSKGAQQVLRRQDIAARQTGQTYQIIQQTHGVQPVIGGVVIRPKPKHLSSAIDAAGRAAVADV